MSSARLITTTPFFILEMVIRQGFSVSSSIIFTGFLSAGSKEVCFSYCEEPPRKSCFTMHLFIYLIFILMWSFLHDSKAKAGATM